MPTANDYSPLDPAFVSYPRNLINSVPQTPGSGRDVNKDLRDFSAPPYGA
jgi:hypothetical protein